MKKLIFTTLLVLVSIINAFSQQQPAEGGFWVVESNTHHEEIQVVKFYNDDNKLLHSQIVFGKIKVNKKKVRDYLNKVLAALVDKQQQVPGGAAWAQVGIKAVDSKDYPQYTAEVSAQ